MQQLFEEPVSEREIIRFEVPPRTARNDGKKRPRAQENNAMEAFTADQMQALRNFIEYGDQPRQPSHVLLDMLQDRHGPSNYLRPRGPSAMEEGGSSSSNNSSAPHGRMLRHALSLLCRIAAQDATGLYVTSAPADTSPPRESVTHLYCVLQALELEWSDICAQISSQPAGGEAASALTEEMHRMERQIALSVDALEHTLAALILDTTKPPAVASYASQFFQSISSALCEEAWPGRVLAATPPPFHHDVKHSVLFALRPSRPNSNHTNPRAEDAAAILRQLGQATSAIVLQALHEVQLADSSDVLGTASTPATSVVAANMKKQRGGGRDQQQRPSSAASPSAAPTGGGSVVDREAIQMSSLSFSILKAKAWSGQYALLGIRRADMEVQALLHYLRLTAGDKKGSGREGDICRLERVWNAALAAGYSRFVAQFAGKGAAPALESPLILSQIRRVTDDAELNGVQQAALRVLQALRAADSKGWFAVPAFDLVNVDFTSIEIWVRSVSFGMKSNRGAFTALRLVLERMVDACVLKYGPTHEFSVCVTNVRHQLVDSARREGLL